MVDLAIRSRGCCFAAALVAMLCSACGDDDGERVDTGPPPDTDSGAREAGTDAGPMDGGARDSGREDAGSEPDAAMPDAGPAIDLDITWEPCPWHSFGTGLEAQCATVMVPARWASPDGPRTPVFLKRYNPGDAPPVGQLWFLSGGPSQSGAAWEGIETLTSDIAPGFEIVYVDHRGTGRSARIGCDEEDDASDQGYLITPSELDACATQATAEHLDDPAVFSTTESARDVGELIARVREDGAPVFVWGGSYGTYWAQRYLQQFPDQPTGVILVGISPGGTPNRPLGLWEAGREAGEALFAACAADAFCSSKLGADPWARVGALEDMIDAGHCPELALDVLPNRRDTLAAGGVRLLDDVRTREYLPAVMYRIERCDPGDVAAIEHLTGLLTMPASEAARLDSTTLGRVVVLSEEQIDPLPAMAELDRLRHDSYFRVTDVDTAGPLATYERDRFVGRFPETSVPVLMLNGGLDPRSPLSGARALADALSGPNQHLVIIALAPHSPTGGPFLDARNHTCAGQLIQQFIADPTSDPDTSCADAGTLGFMGERGLSRTLLGTFDAWENPAPTSGRSAAPAGIVESRAALRAMGIDWSAPLPRPF